MSVLDVLVRARDLLEQRGWCQGVAENTSGAHCAAGALQKVTRNPWEPGRYAAAYKALLAVLPQPPKLLVPIAYAAEPLTYYNDEPGRTKAEVLALFDAAIARCSK